jgi:hypothetical protein
MNSLGRSCVRAPSLSRLALGTCFGLSLAACGASPNSNDGHAAGQGGGGLAGGAGGSVTSGGSSAQAGNTSGGSGASGGNLASGGSSSGGDGNAGSGNGSNGGSGPIGTNGPECGTGNPVTINGDAGVWQQIDVPISYGDCGAQSLLVDPVRASDYYAFGCPSSGPMFVLKSTDYGETFEQINVDGPGGNPWGVSVDKDPTRSVDTPPIFHSPSAGSGGVWKSTDGGVHWTKLEALGPVMAAAGASDDTYGVYTLRDDSPNHVLTTFHSSYGGFAETRDGGQTWEVHPSTKGSAGASSYIIETATPGTWLTIGIAFGDSRGLWRTTTCGRSPDCDGEIDDDSWTKIDDSMHFHGAFQEYLEPETGVLYIPTSGGIRRSTDSGATWDNVYSDGWRSGLVATDKYIYSNYHLDPGLKRALRSDPTNWVDYAEKPGAMSLGATPYGNAASSDCTRSVVLMGTDDSGIWRYIEEE